MTGRQKRAVKLHSRVPVDWYVRSIKENIFQRFWHKRRFSEVSRLIEKAGDVILDIGSSDGTFTKIILDKSRADKVIGIDILKNCVSFARRRFSENKKLSFRVADAHRLPFKSKSFDAVFCLETLEHVEEPDKVVSEMSRVLKNNGYVVVLVPSENFLFKHIVWPLWVMGRGKIWKGTHLHDYSADEILVKLRVGGFTIEENHKFILGMLQAVKARKGLKL